jgi:hypothetical protein
MVKRLKKIDKLHRTKVQQAKQRSTMHRRQVLKERKKLAAMSLMTPNTGGE